MSELSISAIVPCLNGERRLPQLLQSLRDQSIDQSRLEIIIVDDGSTDRTAEVAARFGARVVSNGHKNIERGKAIGIQAASHDLLLFVDDDNELPHSSWLAKAVAAYDECPDATGVQAGWFAYDRGDWAANRYCSLYGIGDPMAFYLDRRDHLMRSERTWCLRGVVVRDAPTYWLVRFDEDNMPTLGSQGYLIRRSLVKRTSWWPYFFHIDSNLELVRQGSDTFVILKDEVIHHYCVSAQDILKKLRRNMDLFLTQHAMRRYRWATPPALLVAKTLWMVLGIGPLARACVEWCKIRDSAHLFHPYLCVRVPWMYAGQVVRHRLRSAGARPAAGT